MVKYFGIDSDNTSEITKPIDIEDIEGLQSELDGKSSTNHNHNLADLAEKSYNSLTDKPSISSLPTGTINQTLRHNGTDWVASNILQVGTITEGEGEEQYTRDVVIIPHLASDPESCDGLLAIDSNGEMYNWGTFSETQANWNQTDDTQPDYIQNKPNIPAEQVNSDWNATSGKAQILNKPTIPSAQIQSDWNQSNNVSLDYIKNKPDLDLRDDHFLIGSGSGIIPSMMTENSNNEIIINPTLDYDRHIFEINTLRYGSVGQKAFVIATIDEPNYYAEQFSINVQGTIKSAYLSGNGRKPLVADNDGNISKSATAFSNTYNESRVLTEDRSNVSVTATQLGLTGTDLRTLPILAKVYFNDDDPSWVEFTQTVIIAETSVILWFPETLLSGRIVKICIFFGA